MFANPEDRHATENSYLYAAYYVAFLPSVGFFRMSGSLQRPLCDTIDKAKCH